MFTIRKATMEDFTEIMKVYGVARKFMKENGNPTQWADKYPTDDEIKTSIMNGTHYVCFWNDENSSKLAGTFLFKDGPDECYSEIVGGSWPNEDPYGVIHSFASTGEVKGTGTFMFEWALSQRDTMRIDTHKANKPMQNLIKKMGFEYCGVVYCFPGDKSENSERIAFIKTKK